MRRFIIFFSLVFAFSATFGQLKEDSVYMEADSADQILFKVHEGMIPTDSLLREKPFTENKIYEKKFKDNLTLRYRDKDFDYESLKPRQSFWDKLVEKINRILDSIFGHSDLNPSFRLGKVLLRLFAIILVGFIIYFLIRYLIGNHVGFFGKKNSKFDIKDEELHENIHEINFTETIIHFENSAEYRLAVRYQFLSILKKLSDQKLIIWNPEKTNKDYIYEIKNSITKQQFSDLALIFDYIWYGEFTVNHDSYLKFKEQFHAFKPQIRA